MLNPKSIDHICLISVRRRLRVHPRGFRRAAGVPVPVGGAARHHPGRQRHHGAHLRQLPAAAILARVRPARGADAPHRRTCHM